MRRGLALVAAAVALLGCLTPALAAPRRAIRLLTFVADRTTAGATSFSMQFGLRWHEPDGGFFGDLGLRISGSRVASVLPDGMTSFGYGDNETLTSHGTTVVSACRDVSAVTCVDGGPGSVAAGAVDYSDTGLQPGIANRWLS